MGGFSTCVGSAILPRATFRKVRKRGFTAGDFPYNAETRFCRGWTFRKTRKHDFVAGGLSAECGSVVLLRAAFRTVRKHDFVTGELSAPCGNTVLLRAGFPQSAEAWFCYGRFSAPCGNVCSDGRCGVLGAQPLGEGVAEAPQGLERGGDFPRLRLHHADFPRPAFYSSRLMKR